MILTISECLSESLPVYTKLLFKRFEFLTAALCGVAFMLGLSQISQV